MGGARAIALHLPYYSPAASYYELASNKVMPAGQVLILRCTKFKGEYNITLWLSRKI